MNNSNKKARTLRFALFQTTSKHVWQDSLRLPNRSLKSLKTTGRLNKMRSLMRPNHTKKTVPPTGVIPKRHKTADSPTRTASLSFHPPISFSDKATKSFLRATR